MLCSKGKKTPLNSLMLFLTITCTEDATIHAEVKLKRIIMLWRERIEIITFTLFKLRPSRLEVQLLPSLHFLCKSGIFILCATPICSPKDSAQHRFGRGGRWGWYYKAWLYWCALPLSYIFFPEIVLRFWNSEYLWHEQGVFSLPLERL